MATIGNSTMAQAVSIARADRPRLCPKTHNTIATTAPAAAASESTDTKTKASVSPGVVT